MGFFNTMFKSDQKEYPALKNNPLNIAKIFDDTQLSIKKDEKNGGEVWTGKGVDGVNGDGKLYSDKDDRKERRGEVVGKVENFVRRKDDAATEGGKAELGKANEAVKGLGDDLENVVKAITALGDNFGGPGDGPNLTRLEDAINSVKKQDNEGKLVAALDINPASIAKGIKKAREVFNGGKGDKAILTQAVEGMKTAQGTKHKKSQNIHFRAFLRPLIQSWRKKEEEEEEKDS